MGNINPNTIFPPPKSRGGKSTSLLFPSFAMAAVFPLFSCCCVPPLSLPYFDYLDWIGLEISHIFAAFLTEYQTAALHCTHTCIAEADAAASSSCAF